MRFEHLAAAGLLLPLVAVSTVGRAASRSTETLPSLPPVVVLTPNAPPPRVPVGERLSRLSGSPFPTRKPGPVQWSVPDPAAVADARAGAGSRAGLESKDVEGITAEPAVTALVDAKTAPATTVAPGGPAVRGVRAVPGAPAEARGTATFGAAAGPVGTAAPAALPTPVPPSGTQAAADPLPSWRDGPSKRALLRFVQQAIQPGGAGAIPPEERIAVFDNDGTLWSEMPLYFPFQFCVDRIRGMASVPPAWRTLEPYASARRGDVPSLISQGSGALGTLLQACSSGMDTEDYAAEVLRWLQTARHPVTGKAYTAMVFQPMTELLRLLRAAGFRTFIVSGGDSEFMRPWTAAVYGIPPEQVIGSRLALAWQQEPGRPPRIMRMPGIDLVVDGPNKAIAIQQVLGRRPVAAFGNSDGDLQMLEWTTAGAGPRLALLVHHTDGRREWAYDRTSPIGRLNRALDRARERGWIVVDMARDWLQIYPPQPLSP